LFIFIYLLGNQNIWKPMQSKTSDITAVVVAFNSKEVLPACLKALEGSGVGITVVDNGSSDDGVLLVGDFVDIVKNGLNQGFGRAANKGINRVQAEFAMLLNPDVIIQPGAIKSLLRAARLYPDAGLLAPRLIEPDGRVFLQSQSFLARFLTNPQAAKIRPEGDCCVPFLSGAALLIRMSAWREVGGFDENIFLFYEDDDLCRRFSDHGWSLVHVDQSGAEHARGKSNLPSIRNTYLRRWHLAWSRGYVAQKYSVKSGLIGQAFVSALKWLIASIARNEERKARYAGTFAGARAWYKKQTALEKQGLEK
jgi:GT2 family glycosyltransferase